MQKNRTVQLEWDRQMMARAIALARRGQGRVEPNPMVGCVITRGMKILGEGFHRRFGGPHAEVEALRSCHGSPRGATAHVSLEPCCHEGKTPPCTAALIDARLKRVVVSMRDPNSNMKGRGLRQLRSAGIAVETGILRAEARRLLAPFTTRLLLDRPYVMVKWAQSLDGKLSTRAGDSRWISGESSRRFVHRMRAKVDAILVGIGTILVDDPLLTAQNVRVRRKALRVVVDSRLRLSERSRLVQTAHADTTLVVTKTTSAQSTKANRLRKKGIEVVGCRADGARVNILALLRILARRGVTNLWVEAGPTLLTSLLTAGVVDEAFVFTAPILIGGDAPSALLGRGPDRLLDVLRPKSVIIRRYGMDVLHHLQLTDSP